MASISMFLFKEGSRNAFNQDRKEANFKKNYTRLFKVRLPQMDAVDDVFRILMPVELEKLKAILVTSLIEKKVLHKFKFLGKSFNVTIDATGIASFDKPHCADCLTKESKHGKITYFHNVLEAKLVTSNGLSISLATEWIDNKTKGDYDKQDCEMKAFVRLAVKLKNAFPRLPMVITADGLYPNKTFFEICNENKWDFIVTFKTGNLPSVWKEVELLPDKENEKTQKIEACKTERKTLNYRWKNHIDYNGHIVNFIECKEVVVNKQSGASTINYFVHLSNISIDKKIADEVSKNGRMRWKIENEGFNVQKNGGYNLEHKFSRVSYTAMKNYYQTLQIAHMINQLAVISLSIQEYFARDNKLTIKHLWKRLISYITDSTISKIELDNMVKRRIQIRLCA